MTIFRLNLYRLNRLYIWWLESYTCNFTHCNLARQFNSRPIGPMHAWWRIGIQKCYAVLCGNLGTVIMQLIYQMAWCTGYFLFLLQSPSSVGMNWSNLINYCCLVNIIIYSWLQLQFRVPKCKNRYRIYNF